ncbi:hypothetical protein EVAR_103648_1 [Eumeta japonica]|uniref:Uncharacterized protein n=1 Tax=Eumeta variegata TaxID=151549 RepID=A0A4C1Z0E0_EUMVA|nr:hypothetical protein EVAR_103648_1 [Eumeta japonica]
MTCFVPPAQVRSAPAAVYTNNAPPAPASRCIYRLNSSMVMLMGEIEMYYYDINTLNRSIRSTELRRRVLQHSKANRHHYNEGARSSLVLVAPTQAKAIAECFYCDRAPEDWRDDGTP